MIIINNELTIISKIMESGVLLVDALPYIDQEYDDPNFREAVSLSCTRLDSTVQLLMIIVIL